MTLVWEDANVDAILNVWFPGTRGRDWPWPDVLFGNAEPGGRLTMTFPRTVGQVPLRYSCKSTGRPADEAGTIRAYVTGYIDETVLPLLSVRIRAELYRFPLRGTGAGPDADGARGEHHGRVSG